MKRKPWRVIAAACIVTTGFAYVVALYAIGLTSKNAAERDFIAYWAAGQQLLHRANPYDPAALLRIENAAGMDENFPQVTPSPPIVLVLAWPLGYMDAKTGLILWLLASLGCILASVWIVWALNGKANSRLHLIGLAFPPALACLMAGQLGDFFLLETALFLLLQKTQPWLAGAALVFFIVKPHLFVPFFLVLLLWSLARRDFKIVAGFFAALAVCCAVVASIDPQAWHQYSEMMRSRSIIDPYIPTLAMDLRFIVNPRATWLQFLPEAAGCIWAVWYFWTRRAQWNWLDHGLLLLLVSAACPPYEWYYDQAFLFPALAAALYRVQNSKFQLMLFGLIMAAGMFGVLDQIQPRSPFFAWTAPAWLLWYLFATRARQSESVTPQIAASAG